MPANRVATAFNYHPPKGGLNARTNLYYLETTDGGNDLAQRRGRYRHHADPEEVQNPALVHDYESEGLLVYLKQVQFDAEGHPVIVFLTSGGWAPGPANGPHTWRLANGTAKRGELATSPPRTTTTTSVRCISTIRPRGNSSPHRSGTAALWHRRAMVVWSSRDAGQTWQRAKTLTHDEQVQPHLCPPAARFPPRFRRPVGIGRRPATLGVAPVFHRSRRHPRMAVCPMEMEGGEVETGRIGLVTRSPHASRWPWCLRQRRHFRISVSHIVRFADEESTFE